MISFFLGRQREKKNMKSYKYTCLRLRGISYEMDTYIYFGRGGDVIKKEILVCMRLSEFTNMTISVIFIASVSVGGFSFQVFL